MQLWKRGSMLCPMRRPRNSYSMSRTCESLLGCTSRRAEQLIRRRQKSDNERRLKSKKQASAKKSSRRGRGDD